MKRRAKKAFATVLLVGAAAAGGAYYSYVYRGPEVGAVALSRNEAQALAQPQAVPVETAVAQVATVSDEVTAVGTLLSNESVVIRPEIAGRIAEIHFAEGARVASGAPLVQLDASTYRAELTQARANLEYSRKNFERADELYMRHTGTERARDEALARHEVDKAAVALAQAHLDKMRIDAPFGGIVGLRKVSVGDYVEAGDDIVNLEDIDPLKVDFRVPERYLRTLEAGQKVRVEVDAVPGKGFNGIVYAIDPHVDPEGRSVALRARLPNEDGVLRPGLFARVKLVVGERSGALVIAEQAVVPRGDDRFVFKVVDGKAILTKVEVGQRRYGRAEIVTGLAEGDVVVTAGQLKIRDGTPVRPIGSGGEPEANRQKAS